MRRFRLFTVPAALIALAAAGCGGGGASLGPGDVAKVGDATITRDQFDKLMGRARQTYQIRHQPFPKQTSPQYQQLKSQAVQVLVQKAEFSQEADDLGVAISQKRIDQRRKQYIQRYYGGSEKKFKAQLKKQNVSQKEVDDDIRAQLIQEALFKRVTDKVKVTPEEIRKYYDSHKQQYQVAESRVVRHILVKKKALAEKLYNQLQQGASFAKLAKKYSKDPSSAAQGGKLTITKGQTVPPFDQTAFLLGKGTISKPVQTTYGWHLIQPISEVHAARTTPFKQVEESIKQQLLQEKKNGAVTEWVNGLNDKFHPEYQAGFKPQPSQPQQPAPTP
jgi:parvulin-like peptidyl-prolyl isomerase